MTAIRHGKIPDWYDEESKHYDTFHENSDNEKTTNETIEKVLKKYKVKTVLDLTCGTGSQVFWLAKRGYEVTGSDINLSMLKIAKKKALAKKMSIRFLQGDVRTIKVGTFDAVLTIFNAVGHLTKAGFDKAMGNIHKNLNDGGIYIFDIINASYVRNADNITKMSFESIKTVGDTKIREIQHSIIDNKGVLISYTTAYEQQASGRLKELRYTITLQLYTAAELQDMLLRNGFKILGQYGIDGSKFSETKTERIVMVAQKN